MVISQEEMTKVFNQDGYLKIESLGIERDSIIEAKKAIFRVLNKEYRTGISPWSIDGDGTSEVTRISQIHLSDEALLKLLASSRLGEYAAKIMNAKQVKIWGTQLYYKPIGSGRNGCVGLHRDSQHMPFFKDGVLTAWLPLTDISPDSSPLIYIKGSHKWAIDLKYSGGQIQDLRAQKCLLKYESDQYLWEEYSSAIPAGGVLFHHKDTLHGSDINYSGKERIAIAIGLVTDSVQLCDRSNDFGYSSILNDSRYCPVIYG